MANYQIFEGNENILIEQNIYDNKEIKSYEPKIETINGLKTSVLYFYESDNKHFYSLGLKENLRGENITIVLDDLTDIFKFKSGKLRRKSISNVIRNFENIR